MSQEKNIEVELRGILSKDKYLELISFFEKQGQYLEDKNRMILDYSSFLKEEGIENRTKDIRLRITNGIPEIIVKLGKWGGSDNRKELSVFTNLGDFDKLVQIFAALGFEKAMLCQRKSKIYMYKGIEFTLVEMPKDTYGFEAEKLIEEKDNFDKATKDIKSICDELGIEELADQSFYDYIKYLNEEVNEIFEFTEYKEGYFEDKCGYNR